MGPIGGRVVDAETKQPLEGAVVLAVWMQDKVYPLHTPTVRLAGSVVMVESFAYLDKDVWGVNAATPFRTALWIGDSERILHTDTFGAPQNHELLEDFGASDDPVWPHSTRRHVLYSIVFTDDSNLPNETVVTRVYLYDVQSGVSRVVAEDTGSLPTPHLDLVSKYDFRGSGNTGVDRLFQASRVNVLDDTPLPEGESEQFFVAWDRATGAPLLDVTAAGYPSIDTVAARLAELVPLPAERIVAPEST